MRDIRWGTVVFILFYLPVVYLVIQTLGIDEAGRRWGGLLGSPLFHRAVGFTLVQAFFSALGSVILALPGAYFLGNYEFRGKSFVRNLLILPFVLPGILVILGFIIFYGRNGIFNRLLEVLGISWRVMGLYGLSGIILAHIFYNFPLAVRIIGASWEGLNPAYREAAAVLGSSRWDAFRRITMPLLAPALTHAFLNTFIYSFLSFTVVLVFGGYTYRTLEVLIYIFANQRLDFETMQMIAIAQLLILSLIIVIAYRLTKRIKLAPGVPQRLPLLRWKDQPWAVVGFTVYSTIIVFFFGGPLIGIVLRSLRERGLAKTGWTLGNYQALLSQGFEPLIGWSFVSVVLQSVLLALGVGAVGITVAYLLVRGRRSDPWNRWDTMAQAPIGISLLTFAFGLYTLVGGILPPTVLVLWAQVFMGFPVVYAMLRLARQSMGETTLEAAVILGASSWQRWRTMEWPLLATALGMGFAYASAFSFGDLSVTLTLGEGTMMTLPLATYRLIGQYRFPQALALGTVFMFCALTVFMMIDRWSRSRITRAKGESEHA